MSEFGKTFIVDSSLTTPFPPNSYNTIKNAVDNLPPNGGTIIVESGIYTIESASDTIIIPSNVSIIGRGNAEIHVTSFDNGVDGEGNPLPYGASVFYAVNAENIKISGFKIVLQNSDYIYEKHLIYMKNVKNSVIEKLYVTDESTQGVGKCSAICFYGGTSSECTGNIIRQNVIESFGKNYTLGDVKYYNNGIGITLSTYCHGNTINNNIISKCCASVYIAGSPRNTVSGNLLFDSKFKEGVDSLGNVVHGDNQGCDGIKVSRSDGTVVTGNQMINNIEHGLYLSGCDECVVSGNISYDNSGAGLKYRFDATSDGTNYNSMVGNICNNNGTTSGNGIHLQAHSQYNTVLGNICADNVSSGIRVYEDPVDLPVGVEQAQNNLVVGNYTGNKLTENSKLNTYADNLP